MKHEVITLRRKSELSDTSWCWQVWNAIFWAGVQPISPQPRKETYMERHWALSYRTLLMVVSRTVDWKLACVRVPKMLLKVHLCLSVWSIRLHAYVLTLPLYILRCDILNCCTNNSFIHIIFKDYTKIHIQLNCNHLQVQLLQSVVVMKWRKKIFKFNSTFHEVHKND